ncbi:MAG: cobyrinate a,c-diamide synthase [Nitrospirota bacterium]
MTGIVLAGTKSGDGKTTITLGLLYAFKKRGLNVSAFKVGPDFIDPGFHRLATGKVSRNLDAWMCPEDYVRQCLIKNSSNADLSIVEGVMGLFDGGRGSTAEVAKVIRLPVILVMDVSGAGESTAAIIRGFMEFDTSITIAGVILNRIGSKRHFELIKGAIEHRCNIPLLGYLPADKEIVIPERHLGLVMAHESPISESSLERLTMLIEECIDIDGLINIALSPITQGTQNVIARNLREIASPEPALSDKTRFFANAQNDKSEGARNDRSDRISQVRIAIARDDAFCFYYEDNLDILRESGAEIIPFSPLNDLSLPEGIDGVYIGGGYPELYAKRLSENTAMLRTVKQWAMDGMPLYAECGGFLYLTKGINTDGQFYPMVGIFPVEAYMRNKRFSLGYREVELLSDIILGKKGERLRGHEFHYSEIGDMPLEIKRAYRVKKIDGIQFTEGYNLKNTIGSYIHIHFGSNVIVGENIVRFCSPHQSPLP